MWPTWDGSTIWQSSWNQQRILLSILRCWQFPIARSRKQNNRNSRAVYVEYRKAGYSKKFRTEHEAEILRHQAAKNHFDELGIKKLPSVKSLREEYTDLLEQKRKAYSAYKQAKNDMKELHNVRANVEYLLEISSPPQPQRSTEKSRQ